MDEQDWMGIYEKFQEMDKTRKNLLKRAVEPENLLEQSAFYEFYSKQLKKAGQRNQLLRLVFCLPFIRHNGNGSTLGEAFAKFLNNRPIVSKKRVIQLSRIDDAVRGMVQLRRLLKQARDSSGFVELDWNKLAKLLWFWGGNTRRNILEDYFLSLNREK
ncbi:MAG TPA: type I-E CRISPR-associated protein Cse2/CasB [bacterium]|nr:type I-E CRISPR-associated protein Cse2/CasB [bacterium]